MAEFIYKGFLISVRRSKGTGGGWQATASVQHSSDVREFAFNAAAPGIADLVNKIEESIHQHRLRAGDESASNGTGLASGSIAVGARRTG